MDPEIFTMVGSDNLVSQAQGFVSITRLSDKYLNVDSKPVVYSRSCLSKLKKMTTETEESHYGCLLEAKCKWNKMADLLELLQEWISAGFRGGKKESTAKVNSYINHRGRKKYGKVNDCHLRQLQFVLIWVFFFRNKRMFLSIGLCNLFFH